MSCPWERIMEGLRTYLEGISAAMTVEAFGVGRELVDADLPDVESITPDRGPFMWIAHDPTETHHDEGQCYMVHSRVVHLEGMVLKGACSTHPLVYAHEWAHALRDIYAEASFGGVPALKIEPAGDWITAAGPDGAVLYAHVRIYYPSNA
jgi:hypothetical protein